MYSLLHIGLFHAITFVHPTKFDPEDGGNVHLRNVGSTADNKCQPYGNVSQRFLCRHHLCEVLICLIIYILCVPCFFKAHILLGSACSRVRKD
jgi:hypothetical protein